MGSFYDEAKRAGFWTPVLIQEIVALLKEIVPVRGSDVGPAETDIATFYVSPQGNDAALSGPAYYVSPNGNDANSGTSASAPFKTLGKSQLAMRVSNIKTTYLMGGMYDLSAPLDLTAADSGQSWLGYPGQTPILDGGNSVERAIYISGPGDLAARDITVRWLTIQNFTKFGIAMHAVRNVTIDSNTVRNINSDG